MKSLRPGVSALAAIAFLATGAFAAKPDPQTSVTIWVAEFGETTSQWCAYRSEATWKTLENANSAGWVTTTFHGTAVVEVTWASPSGDWQVTDHYAFTPNDFGRMTRSGGDATFQTYLDAEYRLNGGSKPTLIKSRHRRWEGRQKPSQPWSRDVPVYGSSGHFPFSEVVSTLVWQSDAEQLCTPVT